MLLHQLGQPLSHLAVRHVLNHFADRRGHDDALLGECVRVAWLHWSAAAPRGGGRPGGLRLACLVGLTH
jgi:hypothetical protein